MGASPVCKVKGLVCSTHGHGDSENLVDHHESDAGAIIIVTMTLGIVMIDVLFHDALAVMAPFVIAIPIMVTAITRPMAIPIPVTIPLAVLVAVPV